MKDVMIDFETLGKGPNKAVCQIGAVFFDNVTGELGAEFRANIDARSHEKCGGVVDADTVYWWLKQSEQARASITEQGQDIHTVMSDLNFFLTPAARIWSHATFDFVTLVNVLHQLNIKPGFSYKAGMDLRTLVYLAGISVSDFPREGVHHDGLADAKHQVKYTVAALNAIKTNKVAIRMLERLAK